MSISKKIKKKVKAKKAPLSIVDSIIYFIVFLLILLIVFAPIILFGIVFSEQVATADESAIAIYNNGWELLWVFPFSFVLILVLLIPFGLALSNLQPIFGNPRYKPSVYESIIPTYPLFSKEFKANWSEDSKKSAKKYILISLIALIVTAPLTLLSLYPREVLDENDRFTAYDSFNQVTHSADIDEADRLVIDIYKSGSRKGLHSYYDICITVSFEDREYYFEFGNFGHMSTKEKLEYLLHLKSCFSADEYEITNIHYMDELLADDDYTAEETQLIYELFDYRGQ